MIKYSCPKCGVFLESPSCLAGRHDECPVCKSNNVVPAKAGHLGWWVCGMLAALVLVMGTTAFVWQVTIQIRRNGNLALDTGAKDGATRQSLQSGNIATGSGTKGGAGQLPHSESVASGTGENGGASQAPRSLAAVAGPKDGANQAPEPPKAQVAPVRPPERVAPSPAPSPTKSDATTLSITNNEKTVPLESRAMPSASTQSLGPEAIEYCRQLAAKGSLVIWIEDGANGLAHVTNVSLTRADFEQIQPALALSNPTFRLSGTTRAYCFLNVELPKAALASLVRVKYITDRANFVFIDGPRPMVYIGVPQATFFFVPDLKQDSSNGPPVISKPAQPQ